MKMCNTAKYHKMSEEVNYELSLFSNKFDKMTKILAEQNTEGGF